MIVVTRRLPRYGEMDTSSLQFSILCYLRRSIITALIKSLLVCIEPLHLTFVYPKIK